MQSVRTRIAPSPTGYPHIGTMYQALFDYAFAHKYQGSFAVRIEDTDRTRFVPDAEDKIYEALDWFGLTEDESVRKGGEYGPYRQSERLSLYKQYAEELIKKGHAYYCFCSKERLEEMRKKLEQEKKPILYDKHCRNLSEHEITEKKNAHIPWVIRLKVPENEKLTVRDEIRGDVTFDTNLIDDQVLLKSDGFPTYHLAVVVDDHLMEITHVLRGEEWLSSMPKHILLYKFFGWNIPLFFHTPVLRNPDKSKLSKRHGHTNVSWYKEEGFIKEGILNFLALMGWSHPAGIEEFSLEEFIKVVELKDLKPVGPIFDITKLTWMNGSWIRRLPFEEFEKRLDIYLKTYYQDVFEKINNNPHKTLLYSLSQGRLKTLKEFLLLIAEENPIYTNEEKKKNAIILELLKSIGPQDWTNETLLEKLKSLKDSHNISMKDSYYLITGKKQGLPLLEYMTQLHMRDEVLSRLSSLV